MGQKSVNGPRPGPPAGPATVTVPAPRAAGRLRERALRWGWQVERWAAVHAATVLRAAIAVVYLWFGVLKFFPGHSPAEHLAGETMYAITLHHVPPSVSLPLLGAMETLIGLGLLLGGRVLRLTLVVMACHMAGTFLPLVMFPDQTWQVPAVTPTMDGQYILKNIVLISGGLVLAGRLHRARALGEYEGGRAGEPAGGQVLTDDQAAAYHTESGGPRPVLPGTRSRPPTAQQRPARPARFRTGTGPRPTAQSPAAGARHRKDTS